MEEATITQDVQPNAFPMLVNEDDLKHEIGEWVVASLNKDKIIRRMVEIQKQQTASIASMKVTIDAAKPIAESNSKLGEKNRELGDAISAVRSDAKAEIAAAQSEIATIKTDAKAEIAAAKEEAKEAANEASAELKERDNTIDELKSKLKKARADLRRKA